jgi:hypothetical protein
MAEPPVAEVTVAEVTVAEEVAAEEVAAEEVVAEGAVVDDVNCRPDTTERTVSRVARRIISNIISPNLGWQMSSVAKALSG